MCTLIIDFQVEHDWPLLLAGNRDEMRNRPWQVPARHWPWQAQIRAGFDVIAEGTWFGVADHGVAAAVLNRHGTLGPAEQRRSRGELVLEALEQSSAHEAARALSDLNPVAYRSFNLIIGDPTQVFWLRHNEDADLGIEVHEVRPGLHMIDAGELDDPASSRINYWLPRFRALPRPEAGTDGWSTQSWQPWRALLAAREFPEQAGPRAAMNVDHQGRFGTVCSQTLAIPRYPGHSGEIQYFFAAGTPDQADFLRVEK